jgi:hypothetical protein
MANVALTTTPEHIPANLVQDIYPWQLLMSAGKNAQKQPATDELMY